MTISKRKFLAVALTGTLPMAGAQSNFPSRPITLYCPFPAGGGADTQMRALAQGAGAALKQSVIVENRPGALASLGAAAVARAKPDGYTLSQSNTGTLRQPFVATNASYDSLKDFTYILGVSETPFALAVRADAPWRTLDQFLQYAKQNPDRVSIAVPGVGSPGYVVADQIAHSNTLAWSTIPFKGTAESMNALLGGHVHAAAESTGWSPYVDSGQVRLLAVFTEKRLKKYPSVPTLKEAGVDTAVFEPWGIVGPAGMQSATVHVLHDAFKRAMEQPDFVAVLNSLSQEPLYMSGDEYRRYVVEALPQQRALVEKYGLRQS